MSNSENSFQEDTSEESNRLTTKFNRLAQLSAPGFQQIFSSLSEQPGNSSGSTIGFVGCRRYVGASTVSIQASLVAACIHGMRTILVDANFRAPILAEKFEIESPIGLSNCLMDLEELDLAVKNAGIDNLDVLPIGNLKLKSRGNLGAKFVELTSRLTSEYDLVVVDLPEAGSQVIPILQKGMNQTYLVGNSRKMSSAKMLQVKKRLIRRNVALDGLFLNQYPA